ncbi:MAG: alpha/beta hydrolase family protein [Alphaproteobacteria bacterium]
MRFIVGIIAFIFVGLSTAFAASPPVEAYAQLPAVWDAAISPNGQDIAVVLENDGAYIVRVVDVSGKGDKTMRATAIGKGVRPQWIKWVSNDRLLLSVGTTQYIQNTIVNTGFIYTMSSDMKDVDILIKPPRTRRENSRIGSDIVGARQFNNVVVDFLMDDPKHILMAFSDTNAFAPDVQRVNVKTGTYKQVRGGGNSIQSWVTDLTGDVRVGDGRAEIGDSYVMSVKNAVSGDWKSSKELNDLDASDIVMGFMENPQEMIVARRDGKTTLGLFIYDLTQERYTAKLFQHETYDVSDIILSADGKRVVGAEYIADVPETVFFEDAAKTRMDKIKAALEGYTVRFIDETPDGKKVVLKAHAPDAPASLILFDVDKGTWANLGSDYPKLSGVDHAHVQPVTYTARDGEKIPAYVTLPQKALADGKIDNLPFIILPHGGPYGRDTLSFDYLAQLLASRGYGVLQMNFRGSAGYGKAFKDAGRKSWTVMQEDVTDGTKWLIEKGYADKNRVCIMGWSYGGYAALMGAVKHSDMYKCAVSIAGVTDLGDLKEDLEKYRFGDRVADYMFKQGFDSSSEMKDNSPAKRADEISIPVFLAHGTMDVNVHYNHFETMKSALKKNKGLIAIKLEGADHSVLDGQNRLILFEALDDFLHKNLGESEYAP